MKKIVSSTWHSHDEKPVYVEGEDNRLLSCTTFPLLKNANVCYLDLLPDGKIIDAKDVGHSDKWLKKNAREWDNLICTWWAYVKDVIPQMIIIESPGVQ